MPEELLSEKIKGLYRAQKSKEFPNPASHSEGMIVIYDSAFEKKAGLDRVLGHELSHQNYEDIGENSRLDYRRATGWHFKMENDGKYYWAGRDKGYIEQDGKVSPSEDYANNLEHFINDPDRLKEVTPEAYSWFKKRYGDRLKKRGSAK